MVWAWHSMVLNNMVRYGLAQKNTSIVCHFKVWYGMTGYGYSHHNIVWHEVVWFGMSESRDTFGITWSGLAMQWFDIYLTGYGIHLIWSGMMIQYGFCIAWYGMVGMVWCGLVWFGVVWGGVLWFGLMWCGEMWCCVVWYGEIWCGLVWCCEICCQSWRSCIFHNQKMHFYWILKVGLQCRFKSHALSQYKWKRMSAFILN